MAHCYAPDFTLDIFFSCPAVKAERGDETATYHPGDTLSGFLKITSRANTMFEDVFITLEGVLWQPSGADVTTKPYAGIVRIWESSPVLENELLAVQHRVSMLLPISYTARSLRLRPDMLQFLRQVQPSPYSNGQRLEITAGDTHMIPFSFKLPQHILSLGDFPEQLLRLPPSLKVGEAITDSCGRQCMQPLVEYGVRTLVTVPMLGKPNKSQVHQFRRFTLIPIAEPPPPIEQSDFPGEFKPSSSSVMRKHPLSAPIGELCIAMDEPEPLKVLGGGGHSCGKAWVNLTFQSSRARQNRACRERWRCMLNSQIRIKTFYSTIPVNEMARNHRLRENRHLHLRSELVSLEPRTAELDLCTLSKGFYAENQKFYDFTYSSKLLLPIVVAEKLIPTFSSLLVARRYALIVSLRVEGLSHQPLLVEIPLQVCYCNGVRSQMSEESGECANATTHTKPTRASVLVGEEMKDVSGPVTTISASTHRFSQIARSYLGMALKDVSCSLEAYSRWT